MGVIVNKEEDRYQEGFDMGYKEGYDDGYEDGLAKSTEEYYDIGWDDSLNDFKITINRGVEEFLEEFDTSFISVGEDMMLKAFKQFKKDYIDDK